MSVRVRFAPSPTGFLHIGGLRTALYNFLFARKNKGTFILRIEDTDVKRTVPGGAEAIIRTLETFGLKPDEGPVYQTSRLDLYREHSEKLVNLGAAYRCSCTPEELDDQRRAQEVRHEPTTYDRRCRTRSIGAGERHVIRLKAPDAPGSTEITDIIHGTIQTPNAMIDDTVLLKSDGFPTYHLASVVDDHDMRITHVIRGDEWIPSTPKHIILYRAFGWEPPAFAHLPLLLNPDKSKLSKRQMDVAAEDYLAKGYLPEAIINFVALLGWNPSANQEIYTLDELVASFALEKVNKSGAVVNLEKLDWLNGVYLRKLPPDEFAKRALPFFSSAGVNVDTISGQKLQNMLSLERDRIKKLSDLPAAVSFLFELPDYQPELLVWKKSDAKTARARLDVLGNFFETYSGSWDESAIERAVKDLVEQQKLGAGESLWPLRVALSGQAASPGPFAIAAALGKQEVLRRMEIARKKLEIPAQNLPAGRQARG